MTKEEMLDLIIRSFADELSTQEFERLQRLLQSSEEARENYAFQQSVWKKEPPHFDAKKAFSKLLRKL